MKKYLFILVFLGMPFLAFPSFVFAQDYDIYVDSSYSGDDSDGSSGKPFAKLDKAAEKAMENSSGSRDIYVRNGTYGEAKIGSSVKLFGQSKKVKIKGTLAMSNGTQLDNLTIFDGSPAILAEKNADVTIKDCDVEGFGGIGIQASPGNGKIIVKNSVIHGGSGKGFYIQEGRKMEITNNSIHDNKEEGLDVRARTSGIISGNEIYGNSESGIEFIIGSSKLQITGNTIKSNGASAIASQFYSGAKKDGKIIIKGNVLNKNRKYALDCAIPSGGDPPPNYWTESIDFLENTIEGNRIDPVSDFCHIIEAVDKEKEEEDNKISEIKDENVNENFIEENLDVAVEEEVKMTLESIYEAQSKREPVLNEHISMLESRSSVLVFLIGPDYSNIDIAWKKIEEMQVDRQRLFELLVKTKTEDNKELLKEKIGEMSDIINAKKSITLEQRNKFSLFGWVSKMLLTPSEIGRIFHSVRFLQDGASKARDISPQRIRI
ncbi:MAG: right-handed parallel beta-helix repeat-containing protein [Parcubacteria group bacterium]|jgi:parallel beta-helix repeat protein